MEKESKKWQILINEVFWLLGVFISVIYIFVIGFSEAIGFVIEISSRVMLRHHDIILIKEMFAVLPLFVPLIIITAVTLLNFDIIERVKCLLGK